MQRLLGGDVCLDFGVGHRREMDDGVGNRPQRRPALQMDDLVARVEDSAAPGHARNALPRRFGAAGLADCLAVELEHRIAADHDVGPRRLARVIRHRPGLRRREGEDLLRRPAADRFEEGFFVDVGDLDERVETRGPQRGQPRGRLARQSQPEPSVARQAEPAASRPRLPRRVGAIRIAGKIDKTAAPGFAR